MGHMRDRRWDFAAEAIEEFRTSANVRLRHEVGWPTKWRKHNAYILKRHPSLKDR